MTEDQMDKDQAMQDANAAGESIADRVGDIMSEFLASADVRAVYSEPVEQGEYLMIPAAEVLAGVGFGLGSGYGSGPDEKSGKTVGGGGGGGGGGGRVLSRPVAVIVASPAGVEVKPVIDYTKIGLAALTALGFMFTFRRRMRRGKIG